MKKGHLLLILGCVIVLILGIIFIINNKQSNSNNKNNIEEKGSISKSKNDISNIVYIPLGLNNKILCTVEVESNSLITGSAVNENGNRASIGSPNSIRASDFSNKYEGYFFDDIVAFSNYTVSIMSVDNFNKLVGSWNEYLSYDQDNIVELYKDTTNRAMVFLHNDISHSFSMIYQLNDNGDVIIINVEKSYIDKSADINKVAKKLYGLVKITE